MDALNTGAEQTAELLDVNAVAELCACSTRTVRRLADGGRMPKPVRFGGLVRWRRREVLDWIENGCPPPSPRKGAVR